MNRTNIHTNKTKKFIISLSLLLIVLASHAQVYKMYQTQNYHNQLRLNTMTGEVKQIQNDGQSWDICSAREIFGNKEGRFCLYETQNMWTFIMLDTYTGKNWQIQYSVKGEEYMFAVPINIYSLAYPKENTNWTNRFQLYQTNNMWTFIMLDSYNGRLWQVQYSSKNLDELFCIPINREELVHNNEHCIFTIQPLTSMYQYYLINDQTGNIWKFQWHTKGDDYRWIVKFQ